MNYNELVSVIMPVHNGEKFLHESIESVLAQTYTNFEFLLIENCSTDSSVEIVKSFNDKRIRLIYEDDCGIVQGYNRGFKEARGDFVIIHDQDDFSARNRIQSQLNFIINRNLDICGSAFNIINEKKEIIKKINPPQTKDEIFKKILFNFFTIFNPTLVIRRQVLNSLNFFDINYPVGTDYDFILRSLGSYNCGNNPELLLNYRIHKGNTSRQNIKSGERIVKEMSLRYYWEYRNKFVDPEYMLSRIHFFYGSYYKASIHALKSIFSFGVKFTNFKIFFFSTFFVLPVFLLRKRGLYYNKFINGVINRFNNK